MEQFAIVKNVFLRRWTKVYDIIAAQSLHYFAASEFFDSFKMVWLYTLVMHHSMTSQCDSVLRHREHPFYCNYVFFHLKVPGFIDRNIYTRPTHRAASMGNYARNGRSSFQAKEADNEMNATKRGEKHVKSIYSLQGLWRYL